MPIKFQDFAFPTGNFEVYRYPLADPSATELVYEDHNRIQYLGANVVGRLLCLGQYGRPEPKLSNIKASVSLSTDLYTSAPETVTPQGLLIPGDPDRPQHVVEATSFWTEQAAANLKNPQGVTCFGTFESEPPTRIKDEDHGTFLHFGLYLSAFEDVEEYLFAYMFIPGGISYPKDMGIKVAWTVYVSR